MERITNFLDDSQSISSLFFLQEVTKTVNLPAWAELTLTLIAFPERFSLGTWLDWAGAEFWYISFFQAQTGFMLVREGSKNGPFQF